MTVGLRRAKAALRNGDRIMATKTTDLRVRGGAFYTLARSGEKLADGVYSKLVEDLRPVPDGLFGTDMAQTFEWKGEA